jgi:hypothetical protein
VLALLRVPKAILGITTEVNRAAMEAAIASFYRGCIKPKLRFIDGVLTEKLARRYDENLLLYHEDPTPDDPESVALEVKTRATYGAITPNEIRAIYGDEPYENGGDDPVVPSTLTVMPLNTGQVPAWQQQRQAQAQTGSTNTGNTGTNTGAADELADALPDQPTVARSRLTTRGTHAEPSRNGHTR